MRDRKKAEREKVIENSQVLLSWADEEFFPRKKSKTKG